MGKRTVLSETSSPRMARISPGRLRIPMLKESSPGSWFWKSNRSVLCYRYPEQAGHGVHHRGGSQFAAAQHVIANRDLFIGQMFGHTLIHALVAAADQQQFALAAQTVGHGLIKHPHLSGKQQHFLIRRALRKY